MACAGITAFVGSSNRSVPSTTLAGTPPQGYRVGGTAARAGPYTARWACAPTQRPWLRRFLAMETSIRGGANKASPQTIPVNWAGATS